MTESQLGASPTLQAPTKVRARAPLRVAFVNPAATGESGDRSLLDVAQGLAARGHEITVVAPKGIPFLKAARRTGLVTEAISSAVPGWNLPPSKLLRQVVLPLRRVLRMRRIELAIIDHGNLRAPLLMARFGLRIPVVEVFAPRLPLPPNMIVPRSGKAVDHLVVHSPEALGVIFAHHGPGARPEDSTFIPEPVDLAALDAIDRRQAQGALRRALRCEDGRPLAVVVGNHLPGSRPEVLRDAIASLGSRAPVTVWLGETDIPGASSHPATVMAAASVVVLTSLPPRHPQAALEAMALGVPLVAVSGAIPGSLIGVEDSRARLTAQPAPRGPRPAARGVLVPTADPQALAEAVAMTLGDPSSAARRAAAARSHVTVHHEIREVIGAWENLLDAIRRGNRGSIRRRRAVIQSAVRGGDPSGGTYGQKNSSYPPSSIPAPTGAE